MDGLINQAKTQLWKVVNEFIGATQRGRTPEVYVALYEYGNNGLDSETHWVRRVQPLSRDLDKISEELFALRTNGGEEYCGAVIFRATEDLDWDPSPEVYKAIFIAGNEPFTQGPVEPRVSCQKAIGRGVIVNTIHCGDEAAGISGKWKDGALVADGKFIIINQNEAVAHIDAPQDVEIESLNNQFNGTFVPFGAQAQLAKRRQIAQDSNAADNRALGALVDRVRSKASAYYHNANWDLVDAVKQKGFDLGSVKAEDLPEELRSLSTDERLAFVKEKEAERGVIQKKIADLSKARDAYVAEQLKATGQDETLDSAVIKTVREQAAVKAFTFEGE